MEDEGTEQIPTTSTCIPEDKPKTKRKVITRKVLGKNLNPEDIDLQVLGAHSKLVVIGGCEKKIKGIHQCLLCSYFTTAAAVNMYGHILMHLSGELSCNQCKFHGRNKTALEEHVAGSHRKEYLYTCLACGKGFYRKMKLLLHETSMHAKSEPDSKPMKKTCSHCQKKFSHGSGLKMHIEKEHASVGLFKCNTCTRNFLYKSWFQKHVDTCPGTETMTDLCCDICCSKFPDAYRLKLHKRRVHDKEKTQVCSFCDFRAFSATSIKLHERTHTGMLLSVPSVKTLKPCSQ